MTMIDENIWKKLERLYLQVPDIKCSNSTDEQIQEAQESLRTMFSDFYRYFLKHHAVTKIGEWFMYVLHKTEGPSMVDETRLFQRDIQIAPEYRKWYLLAKSESGELLAMNNRSEVWVLKKSKPFLEAKKVAESFEHFLSQQLSNNVKQ